MAESSRFWTTNATGDGPVGGYTQQQFYDFMRKVFITDQEATRGVVLGEQGGLACSGTASPIAVAAGSAIVYGFFYESTASVNLTVTTPSVGTTGGRVILRAGWSAQTVRLVAVRNTDGQIAIPALTQSAGSTWEISLYTFTITTGGVITLTDDRKYLEIGSKVIQDGVETASIKDANVTLAKMAANSVDSSQIVAGAVDLAHMSASSVDSSQIVNGAVDTVHVAALNITQGLLAAGASKVTNRQGEAAGNWGTPGHTDYAPASVKIQCGSHTASIGTASVTFPVAFSYTPVVFLTPLGIGGNIAQLGTITASAFDYEVFHHDGTQLGDITIYWLAIGPE